MKYGIVCNGPSVKDGWDQSTCDIFYGCNIPPGYVDISFITDPEISQYLSNLSEYDYNLQMGFNTKLICSVKAYNKLSRDLRPLVLSQFKLRPWFNTGHYAALHALNEGANEVHVWGCDSRFKPTTESITILKNNAVEDLQLTTKWNEIWDLIIASTDTPIVFHRA